MLHDDVRDKEKILVVDDEPDFAAYLSTVLEKEGFVVTVANDGEEALARVREHKPDLVTLDIQMPRKSGILFYRQMKADPTLRDVPVVVVTGLRTGSRDVDVLIRSFFETERVPPPNAYLDKPVDRQSLMTSVQAALRHSSCH
jgi:CheY-like chemotaxis protein